jgi:uncharacterized surface protein with fasciclin (FAS1) repeats
MVISSKPPHGTSESYRRDGVRPLLGTLAATGRFQALIAALSATGLGSRLDGTGSWTLFAPSDHAFERLPAEVIQGLMDNPDRLRNLLLVHVVDGEYAARDLIPFTRIPSVAGVELPLAESEYGEVLVHGVPVLTADIVAANGIIHEMDGVVLPD